MQLGKPAIYLHSGALLTGQGLTLEQNYKAMQLGKRADTLVNSENQECLKISQSNREQIQKLVRGFSRSGEDIAATAAAFVGESVLKGTALSLDSSFPLDAWRKSGFFYVCGSRGLQESVEAQLGLYITEGYARGSASPLTTPSRISSVATNLLGFEGMSSFSSATCTSSLQAIGIAFYALLGRLAISKTGGSVESALVLSSDFAATPFLLSSLKKLGVYAKKNRESKFDYVPFDFAKPSGMLLGEGAAGVFLSTQEKGNWGRILAFSAYTELGTAAGVQGVALQKSVADVCKQTGIGASEIDAVVCHGAGTAQGDQTEQKFYRDFFGDTMGDLTKKRPQFFHSKKYTGHLLGTSSLASLLLWKMQNKSLAQRHKVLVVALGFGGQASALLLEA